MAGTTRDRNITIGPAPREDTPDELVDLEDRQHETDETLTERADTKAYGIDERAVTGYHSRERRSRRRITRGADSTLFAR